MNTILVITRSLFPRWAVNFLQPVYHFLLAFLGAHIYRLPSRKIKVIAITGTKGKSSTVEILNAILEEAGFKTAIAGTIRFKIGDKIIPNLFKMTMPGRFFIHKFMRQAVDAKCDYAIIEMTSEGVKQFRHRFICLDALIFLNLSPEHIESHGSYEKYISAKLKLAESLAQSTKKRKILIANTDDKEAPRFLAVNVKEKYPFSLRHGEPFNLHEDGMTFTFQGTVINSKLRGKFNLMNILAASTFAITQNISVETIKKAVERITEIPGRVQKVEIAGKKMPFEVIVDYAHTADSLKQLYEAFDGYRKICVLGNTGGGRDTWKRPEMGKVADTYCEKVILTNEDPYDDDPRKIVEDMAKGVTVNEAQIIMDRREAIGKALDIAVKMDSAEVKPPQRVAVLITGKGTDPYIMGPNGSKVPWSDKKVAEEELEKIEMR